MGAMGGMGSTGGMGGMMQMMQQAFLAGRSGGPYPMGSPMTMMGGASPKGMKNGDWMCPSCNNHNFASRSNCNKCQQVRSPMTMMGGASPKGMKNGDWMCPSCNNHNFASRSNCNKCQQVRPGYRSGDWTCTGCRAHNFASRDDCLKCQTPASLPPFRAFARPPFPQHGPHPYEDREKGRPPHCREVLFEDDSRLPD
mmetsp:Transcript_120899/g.386183  ORF Transcript_120899/g.386183 Transcript_120899/m.386183 type:complete len:197 (+) Transcript_120899:1-591(+)